MSFSIASTAVERLQAAGFLFRNCGDNGEHQFAEYERQQPGFLQRIVVYAARTKNCPALNHAVLRTKCAPKPAMVTVYDVEHLLCKGPECLPTLLAAAEAHWEQFETAGAPSFFRSLSEASAHYDMRRPVEVLTA